MDAQGRRDGKVFNYGQGSSRMSEERYNYLISIIEAKEGIEDIKNLYPDLKWVMYGNRIFDITDFTHPGGQYIWDRLGNRDISRFFCGNFRFEEINEAYICHTHSISA